MIVLDNDSRAAVQRVMRRAPVAVIVVLLAGTWILFVAFVSVQQVLLTRHETGRFLIQIVVYHTLLFLSAVSYTAAVTHRPISPDQDLAPPDARPLRPDEVRQPSPARPATAAVDGDDDDDIPLRLLRATRSPQPWDEHSGADGQVEQDGDAAANARSRRSPKRSAERNGGGDDEDYGEDGAENHALLAKDPEPEATALMAKGATGGLRWCRKCDGWKPDRCHHCRSCMQCVLKMDHHCPWLDNCVGLHNHKAFMLFLSYTTALALFGCSQAGIEVYRFFTDPLDVEELKNNPHAAAMMDEMDMRFALRPVIFMLLTILGVAFSIALGALCAYHWYLLLNNRTTLEDMNRSVPTALLDPPTRALLEELGPRGTRHRIPGAWRPDHILTRPERTRLRQEARSINIYDVGWRRNMRSVFCGDGAMPSTTWRGWLLEVRQGLWPLTRPRMRQYGAGHFFAHDPAAFQELKALTSELRLGLEPGVEPGHPEQFAPPVPRRFDVGGQFEIGRGDSDSDSDSDATLINGRMPRRSSYEWE